MRIALSLAALVLVSCSDGGGSGGSSDMAAAPADLAIPVPSFPSSLAPPAGQSILLHAIGKGAQIYTCTGISDGDGGTSYAYVFLAPDAMLLDEQMNVIGHHSAGPTWMLNDGSQIVGMAKAKAAAPDGTSIPWLLLSVTTNVGAGQLAKAAYVQRLNTQGGAAPATGCDASTAGMQARVDYRADYYFWGP